MAGAAPEWCGAFCEVKCADIPQPTPAPTAQVTEAPTPLPTPALRRDAVVLSFVGALNPVPPPPPNDGCFEHRTCHNLHAAARAGVRVVRGRATASPGGVCIPLGNGNNQCANPVAQRRFFAPLECAEAPPDGGLPPGAPAPLADLAAVGEQRGVVHANSSLTSVLLLALGGDKSLWRPRQAAFAVGVGVGVDGAIDGDDALGVLFETPMYVTALHVSGPAPFGYATMLLPKAGTAAADDEPPVAGARRKRQDAAAVYDFDTRAVTANHSYWPAHGRRALGVLLLAAPVGVYRLDGLVLTPSRDADDPALAPPAAEAEAPVPGGESSAGAPRDSVRAEAPVGFLDSDLFPIVVGAAAGGLCLLLLLVLVVCAVRRKKAKSGPGVDASGVGCELD